MNQLSARSVWTHTGLSDLGVQQEINGRHIKSCYIEPNIRMFAFAFIEAELLSNFLCFCLLVPFLVTSAGITSRTTPTSLIGRQPSSLFCSSFPSCSMYKALCTGRLGHWQFYIAGLDFSFICKGALHPNRSVSKSSGFVVWCRLTGVYIYVYFFQI